MNSRSRKMVRLAQSSEEEYRKNDLNRKKPPSETSVLVKTCTITAPAVNLEHRTSDNKSDRIISCTGSENIDAVTDNVIYTEKLYHKKMSFAVSDTEKPCIENTNYVAFDEPPKLFNDNMPNIDTCKYLYLYAFCYIFFLQSNFR